MTVSRSNARRRITRQLCAAGALTLAAACGGNRDTRADDALRSDLSMAGRAPAGQQVTSPQELTPGATTSAGSAPGAVGPNGQPVNAYAPSTVAPAPRPDTVVRERVVYRDRPVHHRSSGSSSSGSSSGTTVVHTEPRTERVNHTGRDAAIGGAAGAAIGVATGGLKGGLIGGVLGGAAGAVVGNNADVQHRPRP